jgi:hypothetical protein
MLPRPIFDGQLEEKTMRTFTRLLFACVCIAVMVIASRAQTQPASEQQSGQKVVVNAGEVLFDVVVRAKKGRAVYDLRPSDLEVYEDGVAQQVNSFHLVRRGDVTAASDIAVEVPMEAFSFHVDSQKRLYKTDFSIVVLLKDQSGQVVKKLSKQYQLSGVFDELEATRQGSVLFYQETNLPPGSYKFEAVAYDHLTSRAGVRTGALEVADGDVSKLRLSSVHIIRTAEKAPANAQAGNPFQVGDLLLYPNLGEAVHKEASKQLPFFFTVYLPSGSQTAPKLMIELRQQGKSLAQIPVELSAPDAAGRIQYVAGLPLENIPAGEYELKVTVADGTNTLTRSGFFSVEK